MFQLLLSSIGECSIFKSFIPKGTYLIFESIKVSADTPFTQHNILTVSLSVIVADSFCKDVTTLSRDIQKQNVFIKIL